MKALSTDDQRVLSLLGEGLADHQVCQSLQISVGAFNRALKRIEARAAQESNDAGRYYERALRLRAENRFASLEARFHTLMNAIPAAVFVIDGRTGKIKEANDLAARLFGFAQSELIGKSVEDLVPDEHRTIHPAYRLGFLSSVRKREMGYHPPIYGLRSDGTQVEVAIALTATTADDDVMVVCTEHSRWQGANQASAAAAK